MSTHEKINGSEQGLRNCLCFVNSAYVHQSQLNVQTQIKNTLALTLFMFSVKMAHRVFHVL